jgi:hypothetical protein
MAVTLPVPKGAATVGGAAGGAWIGSHFGIAGPGGAIAGTIPGGVIGGVFGFLGASKFTKCPRCRKVFKK